MRVTGAGGPPALGGFSSRGTPGAWGPLPWVLRWLLRIASQIRGVFAFALESALSRAYWNGFLKLSFVSCPVALYPATTAAERVSFRQVNRRTGHRLKHQLVDSVTGEAVETHDKARGYEVGENRFLLVEDRERSMW